jgi:ribosomal protein S18 acetylase RimI-like enzyme
VEEVEYAIEPALLADEYVDVLRRSTLAERRPVDQPQTIAGMLANADLIVTARLNEQLIGVARSLTDFSYCTYLSDLAVDEAYQRRGIGRELIRRSHDAAGRHTTLILLSAPAARDYYPHIGMRQHDSCWVFDRILEHNER